MINEQRMVEQFMTLVRISSESRNEKAFAEYLMAYFTTLGYEVIEDVKSKAAVPGASVGNVIVKVPGRGELRTEQAIALSAHMDTVEPGNDIKPQLSADGLRVVSDGTTILGADDKGAVAQIIELVHVLAENDLSHPPLELLFPICEEVGLLGARAIDMSLISADIVYVIDGGRDVGDVLVGSSSIYHVEGKITGKAAHAGVEPDKGISSIQVLAQAITKMKLLKVDDETSSNIGYVKTDYPLNVVPEVTTFGFEVRSLNEQKASAQLAAMTDALKVAAQDAGASLELTPVKLLTAYHTQRDEPVLKHYRAVCAANGIEVHEKVSRGGSDLSAYMDHGMKGIVIATGGGGAHTLEEYLDIPTLIRCTALLLQLVCTKLG